jgi:hypothetical protein
MGHHHISTTLYTFNCFFAETYLMYSEIAIEVEVSGELERVRHFYIIHMK